MITALLFLISTALAMPKVEFAKLKERIQKASFSSEKVKIIQAATKNYKFSVKQIIALLNEISFTKEKLKALQQLAPKIKNPKKKNQILTAFNYQSDKKKAAAILEELAPEPRKKEKQKNAFQPAPNEAGPLLRWVGRCKKKKDESYGKKCVSLNPKFFDPLRIRKIPQRSHLPLLYIKSAQEVIITAKYGPSNKSCKAVDYKGKYNPKKQKWTISSSPKRQVIDLTSLIKDWKLHNITLTASTRSLSSEIKLANWPLCPKK